MNISSSARLNTRAMRLGMASALLFLATVVAADIKPGDVPPDEFGKTPKGKSISGSGQAGKVVVVTFWASWCGPCLQEIPVLESVQKTLGEDRVAVIAVNSKEDRDTHNASGAS